MVESLIKAGADFNFQLGKSCETALHRALDMSNSPKIIEILLAQDDIDVNIATDDGDLPLMMAARSQNVEIFELLLNDDRTDLLRVDRKGNSVLHVSIRLGAASIV